MEESESAEVTTNLLIPPCKREHGVYGTAKRITYILQTISLFYNFHPVVQIITLKYKYKYKNIKHRILFVSDCYIYIAFVVVEIKFIASLVCCIFVLITDHTQLLLGIL
jgi:hypothetical protein